jgi:hypothetical protein
MPDTTQQIDPKRIDASPTKEFFIYMITRDIPLSRAVLDLVDNSIDGAKRMRGSGSFDGLWVRLEIDSNHFKIADNCGGMPVDIARNYAFRFGRPKDAPPTVGSVGNFGVGMKRTFFKLGRRFSVESTTSNSKFDMNISVEAWKSEGVGEGVHDWHFKFDHVQETLSNIPNDEIGTRIVLTELYEPVAENFRLENFLTSLKNEIRTAHTVSMDQGLAITVNGIPLQHDPQRLFVSETLKPGFFEKEYPRERLDGLQGPAVKVKLYAGIADRSLHDGGWYVFCNGRLVLRADQSASTIWGSTHEMRQYHTDFAYFRGYAYFDCDNAGLLPWTTTKTGVDVDSILYKSVRQEMIELSKPVLLFLSNLAKEKAAFDSGESRHETLQAAIRSAQAAPTGSIKVVTGFVAPPPSPVPTGPRWQRIQYSKPLPEVQKAMKLLKINTYTALGEKTFEYYMESEGEQ